MRRVAVVVPVVLGGLVLLTGLTGLTGCPQFPAACDYGGCDAAGGLADGATPPGEGGVDGSVDAEPPPAGCDTPNEPTKNPGKCLVDGFGVYVSPTGSDADPGTKAKPFKTLAKALETGRQRVVLCDGLYDAGVTLTRDVEIYGGVACTFDKAGPKARLSGAAGKEAAVSVEGGRVRLTDLDVTGPTNAAGANAIGLRVGAGATVDVVRGVTKEDL
ncbi:MAG TPA: DUF1565 domain-containing protein, partial [Polyangiaceae bacterium]|nr:DUF1565 domain-containing protein [Polyangiaceae bacterium]